MLIEGLEQLTMWRRRQGHPMPANRVNLRLLAVSISWAFLLFINLMQNHPCTLMDGHHVLALVAPVWVWAGVKGYNLLLCLFSLPSKTRRRTLGSPRRTRTQSTSLEAKPRRRYAVVDFHPELALQMWCGHWIIFWLVAMYFPNHLKNMSLWFWAEVVQGKSQR